MRHRISQLLFYLFVLSIAVILVTQASATIKLPAALTEIEPEAFMGDSSLTGLIRIPTGVNTVQTDAFTESGVFAMELPATVRRVDTQNLSSLTYMRVESRSADLVSLPNSLKYITSPKGGLVQYYAVFHHVDFYPIDSLISYDGFYYVPNDTGLTLLSAVDNSAIPVDVTIPEQVDNVWINAVSEYAFAGCSHVKSIALPITVEGSIPTSAISDCSEANVSYYGNGPFVIKSISASNEEPLVGETVVFSVETAGGAGNYKTTYEICDASSDEYKSLAKAEVDGLNISYVFEKTGLYLVTIGVYDARNNELGTQQLYIKACDDTFEIEMPEVIQAGEDLVVTHSYVQSVSGYDIFILDDGKHIYNTGRHNGICFDGYHFKSGKTYTLFAYAMHDNGAYFVKKEFSVIGSKPKAPIVTANKTIITSTNIEDRKALFSFDLTEFTDMAMFETYNNTTYEGYPSFEDGHVSIIASQTLAYQFTLRINDRWTELSEPITIVYEPKTPEEGPVVAIVDEDIYATDAFDILIHEMEGAECFDIQIFDTNSRYNTRVYHEEVLKAGLHTLELGPTLHAGPFRLTVYASINGDKTEQTHIDFSVLDQPRPEKPILRIKTIQEATPTDLAAVTELSTEIKKARIGQGFNLVVKVPADVKQIRVNREAHAADGYYNYWYEDLYFEAHEGVNLIPQIWHSYAGRTIHYKVALLGDNVWSDWSDLLKIQIVNQGQLSKANITSPTSFLRGEDIRVTFDPIENATSYTVLVEDENETPLFSNENNMWYEVLATSTDLRIDESLVDLRIDGFLVEDSKRYDVTINAAAEGFYESKTTYSIAIEGNKPPFSDVQVIPLKIDYKYGEDFSFDVVAPGSSKIAVRLMYPDENYVFSEQVFFIDNEHFNLYVSSADCSAEEINAVFSVFRNNQWSEWSEPITVHGENING